MIVRILGEGQFEVAEANLAKLEPLDATLFAAIEAGDEAAFGPALQELISSVRAHGTPLDPTTITPSHLTVPHEGATLSEVRELLNSEGLAES
jgi:hypothetical protein